MLRNDFGCGALENISKNQMQQVEGLEFYVSEKRDTKFLVLEQFASSYLP
jgi:hypothetical protein